MKKRITIAQEWAKSIRKGIIESAHNVGRQGVHLGSALSTVEILAALYSTELKYKRENPEWEGRDFFILSKGHAYISFYVTLAKAGFFSKEDIKDNFMTDGGWLPVHPVKNITKGIEFSGGSLGTGMPFAVGKAYGLKKRGKDNRVFTLVGDGECNEGSIWEAFIAGAHLQLDNLTVIVDKNNLQQDGSTEEILNVNIEEMAKSCRWNVIKVNGHDIEQIMNALIQKFDNQMPKCIVAETIKGKGISFMENDNGWHHANMNEKQYQQAKEEQE